MGFTVFGTSMLAVAMALLIASVAIAVVRSRRKDYQETQLLWFDLTAQPGTSPRSS